MIDEGNRKLSENNSHISQLVQINSNIANLVQSQQRQAYGPARSKQHLKQYGKMTMSSSIESMKPSLRKTKSKRIKYSTTLDPYTSRSSRGDPFMQARRVLK